ncbi:MAG: tetratricopeptide repeat protein [Hyphomicrobiaceae bacterium]
MLSDRYGNILSTQSQVARDAYNEGMDCVISANHGAVDAFLSAVEADHGFALGYAGLSRAYHVLARTREASSAMQRAKICSSKVTSREQGHIACLDLLVSGRGQDAYTAILRHIEDYPRDALIVQPCTGVFGLIGFSGKAGREAEQLAFMHRLAPHYGDDWWFASLFAFAQVEAGQTELALKTVQRSLDAFPRNANGAHICAHAYYELGETDAGLAYIEEWRSEFDKRAPLHCHISWHVALWALEQGHSEGAWRIFDLDVRPGGAWGPPINVLTDSASFLLRSELAGQSPRSDHWQQLSTYAQQFFSEPGTAFADVHAALAHAMAGASEPLKKIIRDARGPASDLVSSMAIGFQAFANGDWRMAIDEFTPVMCDHERIGGSRAQRDLIEFTVLAALLRLGRTDEARRTVLMRRPAKASGDLVRGL